LLALAFGPKHCDDLAPPPDKIGQQPGLLVWQRARLKVGRLGEMRNDPGIDRIGLSALAERLGEGTDLRRVNDRDGQPCGPQGGCHHGLKAPGRLQRNKMWRKLAQPHDQLLQPSRITANRERFSTWTHCDVEAVLRNVDTNNDLIHVDPSLPKRASHFAAPATVRVLWIDGRGPTLSHGLQ
jgi:hypothetical protein